MKAKKRKSKTPDSVTREKTMPDAETRKKEQGTEHEVDSRTERPDRGWPERSDEEVIGRPIQLDHDPLDRYPGRSGER